jgi:hypothetical protein
MDYRRDLELVTGSPATFVICLSASLMEEPEGLSAEDALRHTFEIMGVKEFSTLAGVPASNLVAFVKGRPHALARSSKGMQEPTRWREVASYVRNGTSCIYRHNLSKE